MSLPSDPALQKLVNALGVDRANVLWQEVTSELSIESLDAPNDRLRFGEALVVRGGVLEVIGRAIKVQALLRGAKAHDAAQSSATKTASSTK